MKKRYKILLGIGIFLLLAVTALLFLGSFCGTTKPLPLTGAEVRKITKKADKGDGRACWCLAIYYSDEDGKYMQWLEKSIEYGDPYGQYYTYSYLIMRRPDREKEAIDLLTKSAEQDHPFAQYVLGNHHRDGKNVTRNLRRAEYWYRKGSLNGDIFSMLELSKLLVQRQMGRKELMEAYEWTVVASLRSNPRSQFTRNLKKQQAAILEKLAKSGYDRKTFVGKASVLATERNKAIPVLIEPYNNIRRCEELARQ